MKIVIAIDSFKGSATSIELGQAAKAGILEVQPDAQVKVFEIADGGEGTVSALKQVLQGKMIKVKTIDLLRRPIIAEYFLAGDKAFIETASVIGIDKISPTPETIEKATTIGLAALIIDATICGAKKIYLTLGGSGTSDGGLGLLEGLGVSLNNFSFNSKFPKLIGLADVNNPYSGPEGYAQFFGTQKGATEEILNKQDAQAEKIVRKVKEKLNIDLQSIPGTGAAGGLGAAIVILGGRIEAGFPRIVEFLKIEEELTNTDLVITGEGRMDKQTINGKVPWGVVLLAEKYQVPVIALCGAISDDLGKIEDHLVGAYSIQTRPISLEKAIEKVRTLENMKRLSKNVIKTWLA